METEARFAVSALTRKFKDDQRWQIREIVSGELTKVLNTGDKIDVISGKKIQSGVKLQLKVQETECFKTDVARSERDCAGSAEDSEARPVRNCEVTVAQTRNILNVKESQCIADGERRLVMSTFTLNS